MPTSTPASLAKSMELCRQLDLVQYHLDISLDDVVESLVLPPPSDTRDVACTLKYRDAAHRLHLLTLTFQPPSPPLLAYALPRPLSVSSHDAVTIYTAFQHAIDEYQPLWNVLDEMDATLRVVEPSHPTRDMCYRRIALDKHTTCRIEFHPPHLQPTYQLLGPPHCTTPYQEALSTFTWDPTQPIQHQLESLFHRPLPSRITVVHETDDHECGVCFTVGQDPWVTCLHCHRLYHTACLLEWFATSNTSLQARHQVTGACPYCKHAIQVTPA